jgi:PAS domain S-box-containing protein
MFKFTFISILIFIATALNVITAYLSWQRRKIKYGNYFAFAMIALALWTLFAALDYAAVPIPLKIFFAQLEVPAYSIALTLLTMFILVYTGHESWLKRLPIRIALLVLPISTNVLAWTNELHHWFWTNVYLDNPVLNLAVFEHGPGFYANSIIGYIYLGLVIATLIQASITGTAKSQRQARLLLLAALVPLFSNLLYLFDTFNLPGLDWSSVSFSLAGLLLLLAIYGSRFMDIIPTARNVMIEQMTVGVLVLDDQGRLIDFNPAAQTILGITKEDVWKAYQETALARMPEIATLLSKHGEKITYQVTIENRAFDIRVSPLEDGQGKAYGQLMVMQDITERKQAEESLRFSEERYRTFIDQCFEAISRTEFDHPIDTTLPIETQIDRIYENAYLAECNQAMADMYNVPSPEAFVGMRLIHAHGGKDNPVNRAAFRKLIENGYKSVNDETMEYTGDGKPTWFLSNTVGMVENEYLVRLWGTAIDITERKQAQAILLAESERRFRAIFDQAGIGAAEIDSSSRCFLRVNQKLCDIVGYSQDEMLALTSGAITHPEDRDANSNEMQRLLHGEIATFTMEMRCVRKDGEVVWVNLIVSPLWENQTASNPLTHLALVEDITERKQAKEKLYESEKRYRELFEHSVDAILLTSPDGSIWSANPAACKLFGHSEGELMQIGRNGIIDVTDPRFATLLQERARTGEYSGVLVFIRKNGSKFFGEVSSRLFIDQDGFARTTMIIRDITERRQAEQERESLLQTVEQANAQLQTLSRQLIETQENERRTIAHELHDEVGQVLSAVKTNLEMMQLDPKFNLENELEDSYAILDRALTQVRAMALNLRPSVLDDFGLGETVVWYLQRLKKNARLKIHLQNELTNTRLPSLIEITGFRFIQTTLTNVERHAKASEIQVILRLSQQELGSKMLELIVRDNGIGFDVPAAFARARQGETFGLLGIQERVQLAGGTVAIESAPGHGCQVCAYIPVGDGK